jgi:GGDEF domain-containing protein
MLLRQFLRPYDSIGRQEGAVIGVLLANMTASDAYLWAEKMRKTIASHVIAHGQKTFSDHELLASGSRADPRDLLTGRIGLRKVAGVVRCSAAKSPSKIIG